MNLPIMYRFCCKALIGPWFGGQVNSLNYLTQKSIDQHKGATADMSDMRIVIDSHWLSSAPPALLVFAGLNSTFLA